MIKVFVVDDSAIVRLAVTAIVEKDPEMELLGVAQDPLFAMDKFNKLGWPDVIILDIEMPRMDGITFLKKIMSTRPTPVIICSSLTQKGSSKAIEALSLGAVDILEKPKLNVKNYFEEINETFIQSIKAASKSKLKAQRSNFIATVEEKKSADVILTKSAQPTSFYSGGKIVAIGSSTGGVQALEAIITKLPPTVPPILITQHMPIGFTGSFAERLNRLSEVNVKEAQNGDKLARGQVYIAPGNMHMMLSKVGGLSIEIKDGPKVNRHKPSVDVLFRSCANIAARNTVAFILTGMGDDGAYGMKELFDMGATTYAQDEKSCVVYGMPKEAVALGAIKESLSLQSMVEIIKKLT